MSYLEGIYWDLDGTLANTELEAHLPAFNKAFVALDLDWYWDEQTYVDLLKINGGKNRIDFYSKLNKQNFSEDFIFKIHQEKQKNYLNLVKQGSVKLKTGVNRLINELKKKNIRQFIVTSSSKIQVNLLIDVLFGEKNNPFEFCIASEDVSHHKPNPTPYLKAITDSGINKSNSIVFEDSIPGVKSSMAADIPTICVKSNIPTNFDKDISLRCIIDTIGDEKHNSEILLGPILEEKFITFKYLEKFLNLY